MLAIGLLSVACIGLARHRYGAEVTGDGRTCGDPTVPTDKSLATHSALIPDEMQPIGFTWTFGADETVHRMTTLLAWADPAGRPAPLEVGDRLAVHLPQELANAARDRSISGTQLNALATVTARGVELNVCVDTSGAGPGSYAGSLTFADPEIRSTPFLIDVVVKNEPSGPGGGDGRLGRARTDRAHPQPRECPTTEAARRGRRRGPRCVGRDDRDDVAVDDVAERPDLGVAIRGSTG